MTTVSTIRRLLPVALLASAWCTAQDHPDPTASPSPNVLADPSGRVRLELPESWRMGERHVKEIPATGDTLVRAVAVAVQVPGVAETVTVAVRIHALAWPTPRIEAIQNRRWRIRDELAEAGGYRLGSEPAVHAEYVTTEKTPQHCLSVVRSVAGRMMWVGFYAASAETIAGLRDQCFEIASRVTCDLEPLPARPKGFDIETAGGFVVAFDPAVDAHQRRDVLRLIESVARQFRHDHEAPEILPEQMPVLRVSDDEEANARFVSGSDEPPAQPLNLTSRCLATAPLSEVAVDRRAWLTYYVYWYLAYTVYPSIAKNWVAGGEASVARTAVLAGRPFPYVPRGWLLQLQTVQCDLASFADDRSELRAFDYITWVLFLRHGPSRYRKAYREYLEELRTTLDPDAVFERHFGEFDAKEMRHTATEFLGRRLKPFPDH